MSETIESGIKKDIKSRGWILTVAKCEWDEWYEATITDARIKTDEDLYLAPFTMGQGETKNEAIRNVYVRALEYLPSLPARYDEHGIKYEIIEATDD